MLYTRELIGTCGSSSQGPFSGHESELQRKQFPLGLRLELCEEADQQHCSPPTLPEIKP